MLMKTRSSNARIRWSAFQCLYAMMGRVGEPILVLMPEMVPFIAEAMEDEDAETERAVARVVALLERLSGENLQDYMCK